MKFLFMAMFLALFTPAYACDCLVQGKAVCDCGPNCKCKDFTKTSSGLFYKDLKIGKGPSPQQGQEVIVHYTGWLNQNDQKFDSSVDRGQPFQFKLGKGEVIPGWDEGVASMKVGGKRMLIIPTNLAYGPRGVPGTIPANATLKFEVELIGIE